MSTPKSDETALKAAVAETATYFRMRHGFLLGTDDVEYLLKTFTRRYSAQQEEALKSGLLINGETIRSYLEGQFPDTVGHLPLKNFYIGLGSLLIDKAGWEAQQEELRKWIDAQIVEDEGAMISCNDNCEWKRKNWLAGHKDALISIKGKL